MSYMIPVLPWNYIKLRLSYYLHALIPSYVTLGITRGSNDSIYFRDTLNAFLHYEKIAIIIKIKDISCTKSNLHNGFPLMTFEDFGFKQATHFARDKIIPQDPKVNQHVTWNCALSSLTPPLLLLLT